MRIYKILDSENKLEIGTLLYYDREGSFIIELKEGIYTIPRDISLLWVRERIIPSGRQNIGSILTNHRLKEYDEMKFLELSSGRCSQDSFYIEREKSLPKYVIKRQENNLRDVTVLSGLRMLCLYQNGEVQVVSLYHHHQT